METMIPQGSVASRPGGLAAWWPRARNLCGIMISVCARLARRARGWLAGLGGGTAGQRELRRVGLAVLAHPLHRHLVPGVVDDQVVAQAAGRGDRLAVDRDDGVPGLEPGRRRRPALYHALHRRAAARGAARRGLAGPARDLDADERRAADVDGRAGLSRVDLLGRGDGPADRDRERLLGLGAT